MPNDASSTRTAAQIAFDESDYDRKYLLLSVPDFDVDPVEGDGKRRMTSYLRLGTVPDDWKAQPGAELELAVHSDYGIGGGRDDLPIGGVVPDEVLPSEPVDARYVRPTPENLVERFEAALQAALDEAHLLDAVVRWSDVETTKITSAHEAAAAEATPFVVGSPPRAPGLPDAATPVDFARFVVVDLEADRAMLEKRLKAVSLGGPTAPLDAREAQGIVESTGFMPIVDKALRKLLDEERPWAALAPAELDAGLAAVRADAARRASEDLVEALTDYPDMLLPDGTPKFPPFADDLRYRGFEGSDTEDADESVYMTRAERLKHSRYLHTRGGWRDHSDGNRITTTHGDKVEVIRGNYKLMVLGRQDDPSSTNLVDYSGQITQSDDNVLVRVEYTRKDDAWHWETVNESVIQSEKSSGKQYSWWWGAEQIDVTGSEDPVAVTDDNPLGCDDDGNSRANPHILSRTWARSIKEYTGSTKLPVPSTYSETWVDDSEDVTWVTNGTKETTTIGGGTLETTTIGGGTVTTTTVGGGTLDTTTIGGAAIDVTTVGGAKVDITGVVGAIVDVTGSLAKFEASAHALHVEATAVGIHAELKATAIDIELNATGLKIEGTTSGKDIDLAKEKEESATIKKEAFVSLQQETLITKQTYWTSKEKGGTKTMTLKKLTVTAAVINLG